MPSMLVETTPQVTSSPRLNPSNWTKLDWQILAAIVVGAILLCFPSLGLTPIMDPSDGYYSEGAREMLESGNFLVPHLNYVPWFEKPILIYWLIALSYKCFGVNELAARLPGAASAALLFSLFYPFCRQFFRRRAALLSTLVFASSLLVLLIAHVSVTDMPLCLLLSTTVGCLFLTITKNVSWTKWVAYGALGLAVLCKGPMAAVLVFVSLFAYVAFASRDIYTAWNSIKKLKLFYGALIVAAIAVPWFVAVTIVTHGEFFQEFFIRQNIGRALGTVNHKAGPLYYVPVFMGGFFPWSVYFLSFIPVIALTVKRARFKCQKMTLRNKLIVLSALIVAWMYPFFTIVSAKLTTYILPMFPALAILVGASLDLLPRLKRVKVFTAITLFIAIVFPIAAAVVPFVVAAQRDIAGQIITAAIIVGSAFLTCAVLLLRRQAALAVVQLPVMLVIALIALVPIGERLGYESKLGDYHSFIFMLRDAGIVPAVCGRKSPSATFYFRQPVTIIEKKKEYISYVDGGDPTKPLWIVMTRDRLPYLDFTKRKAHNVETRGKWSLIYVEPAQP